MPKDYRKLLGGRTAELCDPLIDKWVQRSTATAQSSNGYGDAKRRLISLWPKLEKESFAEQLRLAMQVSYLTGWAESDESSTEFSLSDSLAFVQISSAIYDQPFSEAVQQLLAKIPIPSNTWQDWADDTQNWAFSSAGITSADVLQTILDGLVRAQDEGLSFDEWQGNLEPVLQAQGWDRDGWRRRLIYEQNIFNSVGAGRWQQQASLIDSDPLTVYFRQYLHGGSSDPRPAHLALDEKIYRADDPIWDTIMPTNGFGCGCSTVLLTEDQVQRQGLAVSSLPDRVPVEDPVTGDVIQVPAIDGVAIAEPGFTYIPGAATADIDRYVRDRLTSLDPALSSQVSEFYGI